MDEVGNNCEHKQDEVINFWLWIEIYTTSFGTHQPSIVSLIPSYLRQRRYVEDNVVVYGGMLTLDLLGPR